MISVRQAMMTVSFTAGAIGQPISVDVSNSSYDSLSYVYNSASDDWDVSIRLYNSSVATSVNVGATNNSVKLRSLNVTTNTFPQFVYLSVGVPNGLQPPSARYRFARIGRIVGNPTNTNQCVWIDVRTSGEFGTAGESNPYNIIKLDVGTNVVGDITVVGTDIVDMLVGGNLTGSVSLLNPFAGNGSHLGKIQRLYVTGSIGTPGSGSRPFIKAWTGIWDLRASSINADIDVGSIVSGSPTHNGHIAKITTTSSSAGDLEGSIQAAVLGSRTDDSIFYDGRLTVGRDLKSAIALTDEIRAQGGAQPEISVGRDFTAGASLSVTNRVLSGARVRVNGNLAGAVSVSNVNSSTNGLRGQVIANAGNSGGSWTGSATFGGTTLSGQPTYSNLPSALGTGAVGLVPYRIHSNASDVLVGSYVRPNQPILLQSAFNAATSTTNLVAVEFYGPVQVYPTNSTQIPVTIIRDPDDLTCQDFDATDPFSAVVSGRTVTLRRAVVGGSLAVMPPHGTYKVRPKVSGSTILACGGLSSSNTAVSNAVAFEFIIGEDCNSNSVFDGDEYALDADHDGIIDSCEQLGGPLCDADFDSDGFIDGFDFDAFVLCFSCNDCPPLRNADFNQDSFVDGFDYDAFVDAFQEGCP